MDNLRDAILEYSLIEDEIDGTMQGKGPTIVLDAPVGP